ncbi:hypothetical protein Tco_0167475 [Tanacetum coccineum]
MKYSALLKTLKCNVMLFGYELAGQNLSPPRIVYATRGALSRIETGPRYPNSEKHYEQSWIIELLRIVDTRKLERSSYHALGACLRHIMTLLSNGVVDSWYLRLEFDVLKRNVHMEVDLQPSVDVEVLCCVMLLTFIGIISSMYSGRTLTTGDFHE